jgi:hypothetical protein
MSRIVPSQVVSLIDAIVAADDSMNSVKLPITPSRSANLKVILAMARSIPEELFVLSPNDYAGLVSAEAAIETIVEKALHRTYKEDMVQHLTLDPIPGFENLNPVLLLRQALAQCPDEYPSKATSELLFIESGYRNVLRLDISAVNQALSQGEWKAATVLSGSVTEALLLWAIKQMPPAIIQVAILSAVAAKALSKAPPTDLDRWHLSDYLEIAAELKLIKDPTAKQVRLAKDFRNLIHPGRSIREKQECNRGTALSAVSAVELVVTDLTQKFPLVP